MSLVDWTQLGTAVFTALAALAALFTVIRAERDRADRALPDLHVDVVQDMVGNEVRATVVNYGGPARDVTLAGVHGEFGYYGLIGPTAAWRPGESRTVRLSVPVDPTMTTTRTLVEGRDIRKRYVVASTHGGATKRWKLRDKTSPDSVFRHFFPLSLGPLDVPHPFMHMETIERGW